MITCESTDCDGFPASTITHSRGSVTVCHRHVAHVLCKVDHAGRITITAVPLGHAPLLHAVTSDIV
jgi:hypothetical protein